VCFDLWRGQPRHESSITAKSHVQALDCTINNKDQVSTNQVFIKTVLRTKPTIANIRCFCNVDYS
jgi:hypothetical protein